MRFRLRDILILMAHASIWFSWLGCGFRWHQTEHFGQFYWLALLTVGVLSVSGWFSREDIRKKGGFWLTVVTTTYVATNAVLFLENAWLTRFAYHYVDPMTLLTYLAIVPLAVLLGIITIYFAFRTRPFDFLSLVLHMTMMPVLTALNLYVWYLTAASV